MTKILVKGDVYTVATKTECTVTSANGTPLGKATAGNPLSFTATTDRVELSDPDADFVRVNPNSAPVKLKLLGLLGGGVQTLPAGYLAAEFLENTRALYIMTGIIQTAEDNIGVRLDYEMISGDSIILGSGDSTTTNFAPFRIKPGNQNFPNGYGWVFWKFGESLLFKPKSIRTQSELNFYGSNKTVAWADGKIVHQKTLSSPPPDGHCEISLYARNDHGVMVAFGYGRMYSCQFTKGSDLVSDIVAAVDEKGVACVYDKIRKQTLYASVSNGLIVGLTLPQARNLRKLPAGGGKLTVSLPWEAQLVQHNAAVEAALQTAKNNGWTITVQYRDPEEDSAVYNKYAACTTVADMQAVNPNYKRDLTADGEWEYPLNSIVDGSRMFGFYTAYMKRGYFYFPNMITATDFANGGSSLGEAEVYAPKATSLRYMFREQFKLKKLSGDFSKLEQAYEFLCNTSITDLEADFPSLVDATYFALNCNGSTVYRPQLNKASVLRILNSIPSYTSGRHLLGIGIHVDNQSDDEVLSAIADAESKGWTLTVQWNGTATTAAASTFGLRRMPVYAKLGTLERPDGTTERVLDWGHYVTDWEADGYREFGSVEEAKEYFNIIDEA